MFVGDKEEEKGILGCAGARGERGGFYPYLHGTAIVVTLMIMGHMMGSVGGTHLIMGQIAGGDGQTVG